MEKGYSKIKKTMKTADNLVVPCHISTLSSRKANKGEIKH